MENLTAIIRDLNERSELFGEKLDDAENNIMIAVSDYDDLLRDRDIDVLAQASAAASKLFTIAHDIALGLSADSAAAQQQLQDVLTGLSVLADMVFANDEEDEEALA